MKRTLHQFSSSVSKKHIGGFHANWIAIHTELHSTQNATTLTILKRARELRVLHTVWSTTCRSAQASETFLVVTFERQAGHPSYIITNGDADSMESVQHSDIGSRHEGTNTEEIRQIVEPGNSHQIDRLIEKEGGRKKVENVCSSRFIPWCANRSQVFLLLTKSGNYLKWLLVS